MTSRRHPILREGRTLLAVTVGANHVHGVVALFNDAPRCCVGLVEATDWWSESHFAVQDRGLDREPAVGCSADWPRRAARSRAIWWLRAARPVVPYRR